MADALDTPVAGGEYVYGPVPFRHMMEARSVDIVMVDLMRAGGITQWMKIAGMAEAFNLPIVSHLVPEIHVHLVAAVPNGLTVEYMPRSLRPLQGNAEDRGRDARRAAEAGARARVRSGGAEALRQHRLTDASSTNVAVKPIPDHEPRITPYICIDGAARPSTSTKKA